MSQPRWAPKPGELEAALEVATGVRDLAARLGVAVGTLERYCRENDYDLAKVRNVAAGKAGKQPPLIPADKVKEDAQLARAKAELTDLQFLYREAISQIQSQTEICEAVSLSCVTPRPAPVFKKVRKKVSKLPHRTAILLLSDWQLGELVHEIETGGMNSYSWSMAVSRCGRLIDAAVGNLENQMRAYHITHLVIAILGDIVEGHDIFNGQAWSLEKDAAMQSVEGADLMASVLTAIVEPFLPFGLKVDIYCVPGNHGKPGGRRAGQTPVTFSFDLLLYEMLKRQLTTWPIHEFAVEPAGRLLFSAADQIFLMTHGNEVRGWGGFPYYGLDKVHAKMTMELETLFTHWLLGHWHSAATLPAGRGMRVVNGTMVGANQLTQAAVLTTSAPSQTMLYVSHDFGLAETAYLVLEPGKHTPPRIHGVSE